MQLDVTAFNEMYKRYWKKVYATCYHYVQNREEAEEMTQEVFLSVWKRRNELWLIQSPENYLTKAARYQVLNYFRAKSTRTKIIESLPAGDLDNATDETILSRELSRNIQQYSNELPQQSGRVFQLKQHTGYTNKEIAESLAVTEKSVEYHIAYIKKFLKAKLSYLFSGLF